MKILMVCLGNICRSPLAEGILKEKVQKHKLSWTVDSAGTSHWHVGEAPDPRSIDVAQKYGIDISMQKARQINVVDLDSFDHIFVMDESNLQHVLQLTRNSHQRKKVSLILELAESNDHKNVPDPYWNDEGFDRVFNLLDDACNQIIRKLM